MQFGKHALEGYGIPHLLIGELIESNHLESGIWILLYRTHWFRLDGPRDKKPSAWRVQTVFLPTGEGDPFPRGGRAGWRDFFGCLEPWAALGGPNGVISSR